MTQDLTTSVVNDKQHPFEGASKALRSQEQEQEQYQEQEQEQEQGEQEQEKGKHRRVLRHCQADDFGKILQPLPSMVSPLPFVLAIPLRDDSTFEITQAMIDEWQALYGSVDIVQILKNIRGWNLANPKKRKSRTGIVQHINQWLAKENARLANPRILEKPGGFNLSEHNLQISKAWLEQEDGFCEAELCDETA